MDSTETARRLLGNGAANRPYAELTGGYAGHTPIYTALVAEWRARGRTVPEHHDAQWASFAASTVSERAPVLPVPFPVPVPLLRPPDAEAPDAEAPGEETPGDEAPEDEAPEEGVPEDEAPESEAPEEEVPEDEAPDHDVPGDGAHHDAPRAGDTHEDVTGTPPPPAPR